MDPTFDKHGYPTDATVEALANWSVEPPGSVAEHIDEALDFLTAAWNDAYGLIRHDLTEHEAALIRAEPGRRYVALATGGWSGNECLIGALERNLVVWSFCWRLSAIGGLYILRYPQPL